MTRNEEFNFAYTGIPDTDDKPYEEWEAAERRAYILKRIKEENHPDALNQTQLGKQFGVDQAVIHRDIHDEIGEWMRQNHGRSAEMIVANVYETAIQEFMDDEEYMAAVSVTESWTDWLFRSGAKDEAPDKAEITRKEATEAVDDADDLDEETQAHLDSLRESCRESVSTESLSNSDE